MKNLSKRAADPNDPALFPVERYGSLDYYLFRFADFKLRNRRIAAPDYYINYGNKYIRRFNNVTRPLLTTQGQLWVDDTAILLQEKIEDQIIDSPSHFAALERDGSAFRKFAFATHPDAYLEAGLSSLPVRDLLLIYLTPDARDLLSDEGQTQATETTERLLDEWSEQSMGQLAFWKEKTDQVFEALKDPIVRQMVGRKFVEILIYTVVDNLRRAARPIHRELGSSMSTRYPHSLQVTVHRVAPLCFGIRGSGTFFGWHVYLI